MGVLGCCFVVRWVCYVGARGMCGDRCGAVCWCLGTRAVWRGCGVRLLVGGCPGWRCRPWARFGLWPVVGVELVCGVRGFQGWCRWGEGGVQSRRGVASFLCWWAVVFHVPQWGRGVRCGMVVLGCVVAFPVGGGGTVSRSGVVGSRSWLVLGRCGAARCGLLVVPLVCFSTWAVRGRCGVGLGVPLGWVCGIGVSQQGGCGRVVLGGVGPPVSGPSGAGSAVYGPRAGCHVCGVCGSVGRGVLGVLWPRCGVRGCGLVVRGWGVSSPCWGGGYVLWSGVCPW